MPVRESWESVGIGFIFARRRKLEKGTKQTLYFEIFTKGTKLQKQVPVVVKNSNGNRRLLL